MKNLRNKIPGILGVLGGVTLFVMLSLALYEVPGAANLWLALFVSILMIVAGVIALQWEHGTVDRENISTRKERPRE